MKKYLLSIAALLLGLLAHSQEADDLGNYAEVSVISRLDLNPTWYRSAGETGFDLGNSSIYTQFEGRASEHFSWTVVNHWFSFTDWPSGDFEAFELFKTLGYSDANNFIDILKADLTFGSWTFTLGKDCITTGGHEYDDDDYDVHTPLASPLWNDLACYQWGGKVAWTTPSELSTFSLQMTTSPFGDRPFASGLWTWSAQWSGDYDWFSPLWSATVLSREAPDYASAPHEYDFLISLGNQFFIGDWTLTLDWSNTSGLGWEMDRLTSSDLFSYETGYKLLPGSLFHSRVDYSPSERWNYSLLGNVVTTPKDLGGGNWWNLGAVAEFFPLRDSDELRLHAFVEYDSLIDGFTFSVGARYRLNFRLW